MIAFLDALVAIPKIGGLLEKFFSAVSCWYLSRQKSEQYQKVIDAAALSARASTDEERYAAMQKWRDALSAPRYL